MYSCVADKAFLSSTTISALAQVCFHLFFYTRALAFSRPVWERLAITETGVVIVVSRYQVATPSRTITARASGPKIIADSLMRTSSRTPRRLCGVDHCKRLRRPDSNWRHSAYETDGIDLTSPLRDLSSGGWGRTNDLAVNSRSLFH